MDAGCPGPGWLAYVQQWTAIGSYDAYDDEILGRSSCLEDKLK